MGEAIALRDAWTDEEMRGLTPTERDLLESGLESEVGEPMTDYENRMANRLVRDGRAFWHSDVCPHDGGPVKVLMCSSTGRLALRLCAINAKVRL
jgi:hypothetical protein